MYIFKKNHYSTETLVKSGLIKRGGNVVFCHLMDVMHSTWKTGRPNCYSTLFRPPFIRNFPIPFVALSFFRSRDTRYVGEKNDDRCCGSSKLIFPNPLNGNNHNRKKNWLFILKYLKSFFE